MTLSNYAESFLGNIYTYLGYSAFDTAFMVEETLEAMDLTDETEITSSNTKQAHAILRVKALEKAYNDSLVDFDVSADGSSYKLSQVRDSIYERLQIAYAEAEQYLPDYEILTGDITYSENPYDIATYDDNRW